MANSHEHIDTAQQEPDETKCPECGYLTKHTEHIGCLRKQLNAINAFEQRNFAIVNMDKFPPAQRKPLTGWIDPNDKTQKQYLPHIGEPILFCHGGKTYIGKHNGGSFQTEGDYANHFDTWECHWMHLPVAHNIKEQP